MGPEHTFLVRSPVCTAVFTWVAYTPCTIIQPGSLVVAGGDAVSAVRKSADKNTVWGFLAAVERRCRISTFHADDMIVPAIMRTHNCWQREARLLAPIDSTDSDSYLGSYIRGFAAHLQSGVSHVLTTATAPAAGADASIPPTALPEVRATRLRQPPPPGQSPLRPSSMGQSPLRSPSVTPVVVAEYITVRQAAPSATADTIATLVAAGCPLLDKDTTIIDVGSGPCARIVTAVSD